MIRQIWAAAERLLPRAASAITTLIVATLTSPAQMGVYAWGVLIITGYQAVTDQAARQIAPSALRTVAGQRFLRNFAWISGLSGGMVVASLALVVVLLSSGDLRLDALWILLLALVPIATSMAVSPTAQMQVDGRWGQVASARLIAALVGTAFGVAIAVLTRSIAGCVIALVLSEIVFTAISRRLATVERPADDDGSRHLGAEFRAMSLYGGLAWGQAQLDRVLIGALAGASRLGDFSVASAAGRSVGDALAGSSANVLRVELDTSRASAKEEIRRVANHRLMRAILLAVFVAALTMLGANLVLTPLMGEQWAPALSIVPILALATLPATVSWSGAVLHLVAGRGRLAVVAPISAVAWAPFVAWVAISDLEAAAWLVVGREVFLAAIHMLLARRAAPMRAFLVMIGSTVALVPLALWLS